MKFFIIIIIFIISSFISNADQFFNLDFELKNRGTDLPQCWNINGSLNDIHCDSAVYVSGHQCLNIHSSVLDSIICCQNIEFPEKQCNAIKLTGYIKVKNIQKGYAGLYLDVKNNNKILFFDCMANRGCKTDSDWKQFTIEYKGHDQPTNFSFGCMFKGIGSAWFDNLELYINGIKQEDNFPQYHEPTDSELIWLKNNLIPIKSYNSISDTYFTYIGKIAETTEIMALGEESHGASEIFKMKNRIIKYLIEKKNYKVFALEANMPEAYLLNSYLSSGKGDPVELIKGMHFWTWDTNEMLDLVTWMKEYNDHHTDKIIFTGFDSQFYTGSIDELNKIYSMYSNDTIIFSTLKSELYHLKELRLKQYSCKITHKKQNLFIYIYKYLTKFANDNINDINSRDWFLENIELLRQYSSRYKRSNRDKYMALNLLWIKKQNPNLKIILWAHNGHIKHNNIDDYYPKMGEYLKNNLKDKYFSIAFTFYDGNYNAKGNNGLTYYSAQKAYTGTYEYYFHCVSNSSFMLPIADIKINKYNKWLFDNLKFRFVGAKKVNFEFANSNIINYYDCIIFIDNVTHSSLFL